MDRFDIYLAKISYEEDKKLFKNRPVLVTLSDIPFAIIAPITSKHLVVPQKEEYIIQDWRGAGLSCPSKIKFQEKQLLDVQKNIKNISKSKAGIKIGHLSDIDIKELKKRHLVESLKGNSKVVDYIKSLNFKDIVAKGDKAWDEGPTKIDNYEISVWSTDDSHSKTRKIVILEVDKDREYFWFSQDLHDQSELDHNIERLIGKIKNLREDKINHLDISDNKDPNFSEKVKKFPFPIDVIPNNMGINLSNVKSVDITRQDDNQIKNVDIDFIPDKTKVNTQESIIDCGLFSFVKNNKNQPINNTRTLVAKGTKEELEKKKAELEKYNPKLIYKIELLPKNKVEYKDDESLGLTEKIEKHDNLNPALWDGEELKPEVKEKFFKVVEAFKDCLKEDGVDLKVKDIVLIGSNASYNYTDQSDIDLHIIADTKNEKDDLNLLPIIFNSYKSRFNDKHDINIKGHEVEVYVEPNDINAKSNGIYSLNTGWIKKPVKEDIPNIDEDAFNKLFSEWEDKYFDLLSKVDSDKEVTADGQEGK